MNSSSWPEVTVVVCTYDRPAEIRLTLDSLLDNLIYPWNRLRFHIADDGTSGDYAVSIRRWLEGKWWSLFYWKKDRLRAPSTVTSTSTDRKGWGVNVNTALRAVQTDYVFFTEDDYVLQRPLDLRACVALMGVVPTIGMVRFGLAGHDGLGCYLHEADISGWLPDFREDGLSNPGKVNYWEIERGVSNGSMAFYKYSNRPHLKHRRFHETYGYYPEGRPLALTEEGMNHLIKEVPVGPSIVCPADWVGWHFDHIGVSRQGTEADIHGS